MFVIQVCQYKSKLSSQKENICTHTCKQAPTHRHKQTCVHTHVHSFFLTRTHIKISLHSPVIVAVAETFTNKVTMVEDVVGHKGLHVGDVTLLCWTFTRGVNQPRVCHQVALIIHQETPVCTGKPWMWDWFLDTHNPLQWWPQWSSYVWTRQVIWHRKDMK